VNLNDSLDKVDNIFRRVPIFLIQSSGNLKQGLVVIDLNYVEAERVTLTGNLMGHISGDSGLIFSFLRIA
jgi:hypothetical protein